MGCRSNAPSTVVSLLASSALLLVVDGVALAAAAPLLADLSTLSVDETDHLSGLPQFLTATRLAQPRHQTPAALSIIDRAMIDASGAQEISDLLRLVPGFQAYHVNGHKFGVTPHGLGMTHPGRIEVMVNGQSAYIAALSSTDWRALGISLAEIERIEVSRGPNVTAWGSNAFLAAINIITREPTGLTDQRVDLTLGDSGRTRVSAASEGWLGQTALRVSGGYYDAPGFSSADAGYGGHLNLHASASPTLHDRINVQFSISEGRFGVADRFERYISQRDYLGHRQSLSWRHEPENLPATELRIFHNYLRYDIQSRMLSEFLGIDPVVMENVLKIPDEPIQGNPEQGDTHRFDIELNQQYPLTSQLRAFWGGGWRRDTGHAPFLLNTEQTLDEAYQRLFASLEWKPRSDLTTHLGMMAEQNSKNAARLSPRLALNYQLQPNQSVRAIWSQAYRAPSLLEATQDTRVTHSNGRLILWRRATDPNIRPEKIRTHELGYLWQFWSDRGALDLRLFEEQIDDGIGRKHQPHNEPQALDPLPRLLDPNAPDSVQWLTLGTNNARWRTRGIELELDLKPNPRNLLALRYSYLALDDQAPGAYARPDQPSKPPLDLADTAPRHLVTLLASHRFHNGYQLSGSFYHVPSLEWINGARTPAYNRLDMRLAKETPFTTGTLRTALVVQNLTAQYEEFQTRNQFDTRAFLSLSWSAR